MNIKKYFNNTYRYVLHTIKIGIYNKILGALFMTLFYYFNIQETKISALYFSDMSTITFNIFSWSFSMTGMSYGIIRMITVIFLSIIFRLCADYFISKGNIKMLRYLQLEIIKLFQKTDSTFYIKYSYGTISDTYSRHITMLDQLNNLLFIELIPGLCAFTALLFTLPQNLSITLILFCIAFIGLSVFAKILSGNTLRKQGDYSSAKFSSIVDLINSLLVTKIFKTDKFTYDKFEKCTNDEMNNKMKYNFLNNTSFNILFSVCAIIVVPLTVFTIAAAYRPEQITPEYMNFSRIMLLFGVRVGSIGKAINTMSELPQTLNVLSDMKFKEHRNLVTLHHYDGLIIKNMNFSINGCELFKNFSIEISPSDKILIIGSSGVGKSTLLNMLSKIIDAPNNSIFVKQGDELIDLNHIDNNSWYDKTSYVMQDSYMFPTSFRENILMGRTASDTEVSNAIISSELTEKILEIGIDKNIEKLSGGQKQRLALARFFLKDYSFILLDEITSGLDSKNSLSILQRILDRYKGKSILAISHDTSWVKYFDKILYLESEGRYYLDTHENLYNNSSEYRKFFVIECM